MSDKLEFIAEVRDGKLFLTDQQSRTVDAFLSGRRKPVRFVLSKKTDVRSNEQNRLYWGYYIAPLARHLGYDQNDVHEFCRDMFLPPRFVTIAGREKEIRKTTTDLSPPEFSDYLRSIEVWASTEFGIMLGSDQAPAQSRASA